MNELAASETAVTHVLVVLAEKPGGRYYEQVVRGATLRPALVVTAAAAAALVSRRH